MFNNSKRLFTFGCSFTKYFWPLWPEIISYEFKIPLYNFGRCGAGNQYIFNLLMQADNVYNFNEDDLIIISWTNVCREDRYRQSRQFRGYAWETPGNIFSQQTFSKEFVEQWADPLGYMIRDFATIKSTVSFLKNKSCNYSMFAMCDITSLLDQWKPHILPAETPALVELYQPYLSEIKPSFYDVLWDGNIQNKFDREKLQFSTYYGDGHPMPIECLTYLESIYNYKFSNDTVQVVENNQSIFEDGVKKCRPFKADRLYSQLSSMYKKTYLDMDIDPRIFN